MLKQTVALHSKRPPTDGSPGIVIANMSDCCTHTGFASEQCPEGFVAVAQSSLRILTLERLGEVFNQSSVQLRYTPRGFALDPTNKVPLLPSLFALHLILRYQSTQISNLSVALCM